MESVNIVNEEKMPTLKFFLDATMVTNDSLQPVLGVYDRP